MKLSRLQLEALTLAAAKSTHGRDAAALPDGMREFGRLTAKPYPRPGFRFSKSTTRSLVRRGLLKFLACGGGEGASGRQNMFSTYEITPAGIAATDPEAVAAEFTRILAKSQAKKEA